MSLHVADDIAILKCLLRTLIFAEKSRNLHVTLGQTVSNTFYLYAHLSQYKILFYKNYL